MTALNAIEATLSGVVAHGYQISSNKRMGLSNARAVLILQGKRASVYAEEFRVHVNASLNTEMPSIWRWERGRRSRGLRGSWLEISTPRPDFALKTAPALPHRGARTP